jgi:hypothetical protein
MTVRTQTVSESDTFTDQDILKVAELGGERPPGSLVKSDNQQTVIREWPSMESAQAWCDYVLPFEGVISAEILED